MPKKEEEFLDLANAKTLADLIADPDTSERIRIKIINKLVETKHSDNFFKTILEERLTEGSCPSCGLQTQWLIPEDELNKLGIVTHEIDKRVPQYTDEKSCVKWQQSCKKRKVSI
mgnify:CR=1 FL=1